MTPTATATPTIGPLPGGVPLTGQNLEGKAFLQADNKFIGNISNNQVDLTSVCNKSGDYGSSDASKVSSVRNPSGPYGSPDPNSPKSAYNTGATQPPAIVLTAENRVVGYLTKNTSFGTAATRLDPDQLFTDLGCK